jgi:TRAF3-interacting protein 1
MSDAVSEDDLDALTFQTVDWIKRATRKEIASPSLLKRPPFRFIHEIVMEVVVVTGFGLGVWDGSEMDAVGLRSSEGREGKTRFLQKLIAITLVGKRVGEFTGQFRPSAIIAGNEPDRTNILLQV